MAPAVGQAHDAQPELVCAMDPHSLLKRKTFQDGSPIALQAQPGGVVGMHVGHTPFLPAHKGRGVVQPGIVRRKLTAA